MVVEILCSLLCFGGRALGSATGIALAARGFSKLSAGLAGQDDGVTVEGHSIARESLE